jgi:hypothetical protein
MRRPVMSKSAIDFVMMDVLMCCLVNDDDDETVEMMMAKLKCFYGMLPTFLTYLASANQFFVGVRGDVLAATGMHSKGDSSTLSLCFC